MQNGRKPPNSVAVRVIPYRTFVREDVAESKSMIWQTTPMQGHSKKTSLCDVFLVSTYCSVFVRSLTAFIKEIIDFVMPFSN